MRIAFVGGGNMASALVGGLRRAGTAASDLLVIEIDATRRAALAREVGVTTAAAPDESLRGYDVVVLAVKPQQMREACTQVQPFIGQPLVLSIAAGIRARDLARWLRTEMIVRAMPNTPALAGLGVTGLVALSSVTAAQREAATAVMGSSGEVVWFEDENQLDIVTAVSGSGPAYVFYFMEALIAAGKDLGLSEAHARTLSVETFAGASRLAAEATESIDALRRRVTSPGGTTAAALASLEADQVEAAIVRAVRAAHRRARELGDDSGKA